METIHAITYNKHTGEYTIESFNRYGEKLVCHANRLTDGEIEFAKNCKYYHDGDSIVTWVN